MSTFYHRFLECAARWPGNVALELQRRDRVESYTYAQVRQMTESVARWLSQSPFPAGSRFALLADNHPRWVATYMGIMAAGHVAVPLDTALHTEQLAKLLKDSGSSLVFCDVKHATLAGNATSGLNAGLVLLNPSDPSDASAARDWVADMDSILAAGPGAFSPPSIPSESVGAIVYTSGTTADPKGVMLTHANFLGEVEAVFSWVDVGPEDAVLGILPMFHVLAQMGNILLPLVKGARVVYLETLNTTELLRAFSERNITVFAVVPQFFYLIHERIFKEVAARGHLVEWGLRKLMLLNRRARRLGFSGGNILFRKVQAAFGEHMRYLITGGSRFDPQIAEDFYALGIDILQAYGLSETAAAAFATPPDDNLIGSVGKPLKDVEGKIVDAQPQEEGGPAVGEILIRGPIVMKGYWNRPEATAATLQNGWLYTGDLGYFDADGNLFITGRKKEVIVLANGKNIYPEEIEAHYQKSPFVKEICVLGLEARPGDPSSERLHGVVVPNFSALRERKIVNAKEVIRFDIEGLSAQLPSTKRIGSYEIWQEDLPRTTTRKLKRYEIEKRVRVNQQAGKAPESDISERALTADEQAWLEQSDVQRALKVVRAAQKNGLENIRPDNNLELDLGLDSMQRIELLVALEKELGGDVDESRVSEVYTVREMVDLIRESAARGGKLAPSAPQFAGWKNILQEQPADPDVLALAWPKRFAEVFWYSLSRLVGVFAHDRFKLQVTGLEKLPSSGPYIISSNHQSFLDPVILGSVLPWDVFRNTFSVGTSEIFGSGPMRHLARWLRVIVVDPDANLIPAMRAGAFGLRRGRVLILYPEGERSIDGTPKTFKKGAAILSIHLQVPIVPVAIEGFERAWPRGKKFQGFFPLKMKIGDPISPPAESSASEAAYEQLTAELKARVVRMWEELQGVRRKKAPAKAAD